MIDSLMEALKKKKNKNLDVTIVIGKGDKNLELEPKDDMEEEEMKQDMMVDKEKPPVDPRDVDPDDAAKMLGVKIPDDESELTGPSTLTKKIQINLLKNKKKKG